MRFVRTTILISNLFFASVTASIAGAADIAIIVNKINGIDGLSFDELVKIFEMDRRHWRTGSKIYLLMQETGTAEKSIILKKVYKKSDKELKKHWLSLLFTEQISSFPKTLGSNQAVKQFISKVPNAVGFIDATYVDDSIKVLAIDGELPGSANYKLKSVYN